MNRPLESPPLGHPAGPEPGLRAASQRALALDPVIAGALAALPSDGPVALVALGAFGRCELTPRADIDVLLLHDGSLSTAEAAQALWYPLWERTIRLEPVQRTVDECVADRRRSLSAALNYLDARLIAGDPRVFAEFVQRAVAPLRTDRAALRQRLSSDVQRRHAAHPALTESAVPDLINGRGGLRDLQVLRSLDPVPDARARAALDFLLQVVSAAEEVLGNPAYRLSPRLQERVAAALDLASGADLMARLYSHARWVAFMLDGALAPPRSDRSFGLSLSVRGGYLSAERLPRLERIPSLGLSIAHLVGLAPPSAPLLAWSSMPGGPVAWDDATRHHWWLLLRAADWRAWSYLDVTGLLVRYVPEWEAIAHVRRETGSHDLAVDSHSFLALRRLHEWLDSNDPFANRLWRTLRGRDWVYLAVLIHELGVVGASSLAQRMGLPADAIGAIACAVEHYPRIAETATQRDLHDEDLVLELAARIGTRQRLRLVFLVAVAHALAAGGDAWNPWKVALWRQLFTALEVGLRPARAGGAGTPRARSLEPYRERLSRELARRNLADLVPMVARLPRRYLLTRSSSFMARHLALLVGDPLQDGEVRVRAHHHRRTAEWDLLIVARDRPGLLASVTGVLALRGATVLAADAATTADGLVLDVFTVGSAYGVPLQASLWPKIQDDLQRAIAGRLPLDTLLASAPVESSLDAPQGVAVQVDNAASQFFSLIEVRAPDRVGLLYRITRAFHELGLDIHHAKIATYPDGALDVFYVWDLAGRKLDAERAVAIAPELERRIERLSVH